MDYRLLYGRIAVPIVTRKRSCQDTRVFHCSRPFSSVTCLTIPHQVKQVLQEQLAKFSLQVNPELEAKTNLLKSDPALYQLYNDLVVGRLITAEEFWANRFTEGKLPTGNGGIKGQPLKAGEEQQEIGLPSAFLVRKVQADIFSINFSNFPESVVTTTLNSCTHLGMRVKVFKWSRLYTCS